MALTLTTENTVLGALTPKTGAARLATNVATVLLGTVLLWVSSQIKVPVWPVPVTLQGLAVAGLAAAFGWRIGVATLLAYIAEGLMGLPVFANGGGIGYLMSPSFGFILGWVPMAFIIGYAADKGASRNGLALFAAALIGDAVSFAFGFAWMLVVFNVIQSSGVALPNWVDASNLVGTAWSKAVQPFILWDIVKMAFAAATVAGIWRLLPKKG